MNKIRLSDGCRYCGCKEHHPKNINMMICDSCGIATDIKNIEDAEQVVTINRTLLAEVVEIAEDNTKEVYNLYLAAHEGFTRKNITDTYENELAIIEKARGLL